MFSLKINIKPPSSIWATNWIASPVKNQLEFPKLREIRSSKDLHTETRDVYLTRHCSTLPSRSVYPPEGLIPRDDNFDSLQVQDKYWCSPVYDPSKCFILFGLWSSLGLSAFRRYLKNYSKSIFNWWEMSKLRTFNAIFTSTWILEYLR